MESTNPIQKSLHLYDQFTSIHKYNNQLFRKIKLIGIVSIIDIKTTKTQSNSYKNNHPSAMAINLNKHLIKLANHNENYEIKYKI